MTTNTRMLTLWILAAAVLLSGTMPAWAASDCCLVTPGCCESDADGGATPVAAEGGCGCDCFDQAPDPVGPFPVPRQHDHAVRVAFATTEAGGVPLPWPTATTEGAAGRDPGVFSGTDVRAQTCVRLL